MKTFEQIDEFTFRLSKGTWTEQDRLSAVCVSLQEDGNDSFIGDVRIIWPDALNKFLFHVFTDLFSDNRLSYKMAVFNQLRVMYKSYQGSLRADFFTKIDYEKPLYKHQLDATVLMLPHKFNFLSLDMGLGKSIISANLSKILRVRRTIIVCPSGIKWNWYHDMTDCWGYDPLYWSILDATRRKCVFAFSERFVVVNYEMIKKDWVWEHLLKSDVGHIILDEVHKIKNQNTKIHKNVRDLIDEFPEARVTMLSGTPITNRVNDLFAYFKLAGHPLGNNYSSFMRRYVRMSSGSRGKMIGAKNIDELTVRNSNFMIRKKAEECLDLPELIINKYYFEETEITEEYKQVLAEMYQSKLALADAQENKSITQLSGAITDNVHSLNRILATAKADSVIKLVDKIWSQGRKVIVFATYKSALSALEDHYGDRCVKIDGSVDSHKRSKLIERFYEDDNCYVFLGNVKAAGVGINLVNSCDVIFMNFPFTPDDLEQPQKRAHRIGQTKNVNVYYTIVKNSIDAHIYDIICDKSADINSVLDKGKKGVVNYGSVTNKVFKKLLDQYAEDQGLQKLETDSKFIEV